MNPQSRQTSGDDGAAFVKGARQQRPGLFAELIDFIQNNKKWWLTPIVVMLVLLGVLVLLGGTSAAPFIYTLF